ncbi:hypothetical protein BIV57_12585 [Mangrovactinospora gilvigrisea]|uniref:Beta-N-acetylhexosaminidase n=1 Tax=Mangrovactinospora gilvigrisea TaxID=1428644 RepID=A0A1J7BEN7_9ACTN|nr:glycoside hydrolase family 20 protein [Mangrovactinospora gilvigrisea]OIV37159.1 hypothetical protein BIV57_12585 [Mangrovactinospora gilvigrisea]
MSTLRRRNFLLGAAGAGTAALAAGCGGSVPGVLGGGLGSGTSPDASAEPSASRPAGARDTPRPRAAPALPAGTPAFPAVPAVRSHRPGPPAEDWWPRPGARVVVPAGKDGDPLAASARLLAADLGLATARGAPADGDVLLTLGGAPAGVPSAARGEAYGLTVRHQLLTVTAPAAAGVHHGTRTVAGAVRARRTVPAGTVADWPDRAERGLTLDIARKPFAFAWIRDRLAELGELKLNQLHLHFSDDQGFRIESSSHPEIVSSDHLTKQQIKQLIAFAAERQITLIPEIDSPGHLGQALTAHPQLALRGPGHAPPGAVDISLPAAKSLVTDLVDEYAELFTGPDFHLGGDEYAALLSSHPETAYPQLASYAVQRYGAGAKVVDATVGWTNDLAAHAVRLGKRPRAWNDGQGGSAVGGKVAPDRRIRVEYWTGTEVGSPLPEPFLAAGRPLLNMNDGFLYYVLGEPRQYTYPTGQKIYEDWTPAVLRGTQPVPARLAGPTLVPGARLGIWCDQSEAQTQAEVAAGVRMPLRALAQRLWNPVNPPGLGWAGFGTLAGRCLG